MPRRVCRFCGQRVGITWAGRAIAPDEAPPAIYVDHGLCPGGLELVEPPPEVVAQVEDPKPKRPGPKPAGDRDAHVLELLETRTLTAPQAAKELACSVTTATKVLTTLYRAGRLVRARRQRGQPYRYALPAPVPGPVAAEIWLELLAEPNRADVIADRLRRHTSGVRSVLGRLRTAGRAESLDGRWHLVG